MRINIYQFFLIIIFLSGSFSVFGKCFSTEVWQHYVASIAARAELAYPSLSGFFLSPPPSVTVSVRVSAGSDDAEQSLSSGSVTTTSSDLELISDNGTDQIVGLRFSGINIPPGATITGAYVEFETDETNTGQTDLTISGQDIDDAPAFASSVNNISNRTKTTASVVWSSLPAWNTVNEKHQTPDISTIIQEIIDRPGWSAGNALAILIQGSGERTAESYNGEAAAAPLLVVQYTTGAVAEICNNGLDDDGDGLVDCDDPDCFESGFNFPVALTNAGFEDNLNGWYTDGSPSVSADAHTGAAALVINAANEGISQIIPVTPGQPYQLELWAKKSGINWTGFGLDFQDAGWNRLGAVSGALKESASYQKYSITGVAPPGSAQASVWFYTEGGVTSKVDDITVRTTGVEQEAPNGTGPQILLMNNGFEQHDPSLTFPLNLEGNPAEALADGLAGKVSGWMPVLPSNYAFYVNDTQQSVNNPEGDYFIYLTGSGFCWAAEPVAIISTSTPLVDGQSYTLSFQAASWTTSLNGSGLPDGGAVSQVRGIISAEFVYTSTGTPMVISEWEIPASSNWANLNWQRLTYTFVYDAADPVQQIIFTNDGSGGVAIDGIELRQTRVCTANCSVPVCPDELMIDPFTSLCPLAVGGTYGLSDSTDCMAADVLCGYRGMYLTLESSGSFGASLVSEGVSGTLNISEDSMADGKYYLTYDGPQGNGSIVPEATTGLGGLDFSDRLFYLTLVSGDFNNSPADTRTLAIDLNVWSAPGRQSKATLLLDKDTPDGALLVFSSFLPVSGGGADFSSVTALQLFFQTSGTAIDASFDDFKAGCISATLDPDVCYIISDGDNGTGGSNTPDTLFSINHQSGVLTTIGPTGTYSIEAMAIDPVNEIIYAISADTLGTINISDGVFTAVAGEVGSLNGAEGMLSISDVDGLTYDTLNQVLWATARRGSGSSGFLPDDLLLQIDPATGLGIPNAFGAGVGYLVIATTEHDLDDIAIGPNGTLYAISNQGGWGNQRLGTIDKTAGAWTEIADHGIADVEGMSFTSAGQLIVTTGDNGPDKNRFFTVDPQTAESIFISDLAPAKDVEACACRHSFLQNGLVGDYVWADLNNDGVQDPDEPGVEGLTVNLLDGSGAPVMKNGSAVTTLTDVLGRYWFEGLVAGTDYIVEFVLPAGANFTAQNTAGDANLDSDPDTGTGRTSPFQLAYAGQFLKNADAGLTGLTGIPQRDCNDEGQLLVADTGGHILRFDQNTGTLIDTFIKGLATPKEMVVGNDDWLYVSDASLGEIRKYSLITGAYVETLINRLNSPNGMVIGPDGFLYLNNKAHDEVLKIDPETGNDTVFVANGTGGLESNRGGIAFGPDGHLYVTSKYTNNVLRFNGTTGAFMGVFAAGVDQPHDLVFGPDSNLYVANRGTDNVMRFDGTTGAFIDVFVAANSGGMNNPDHLLFGADGHLYVSSATGAGEIYRYDGTTGTFLDIFTAGLNAPAGLFFAPVPGCGENCSNGIDDDGDGLADCDDPHCPCSTLLNLSMCREPDIMSGFISTSYDAATDQLTVSGFAMTFDSVGAGAVVNISGGGFNIATTIDNTGVATAGTLTLSGMAGTYNGTLLTGNLTDFGYLTGGGDLFEFVFDVTGGLMADEFGGVGNQVGVILSALSNFNGNWNLSFSSPASSVADVAPVNCPIGGQVRSDTDNDGDLLDADAGLPGVTVVLYDDPECDGVPNSTLASAITDADGRYYFPNIAEGCYVVQELDLPSYVSTNDKDLVNDNFIALNMPALNAYPSLDNDFLDFISLVEICNNGLDDDGDGLTDCADPDCGPPVLTDVTIGQPDNCPLLNNGQITIAATGTDLQYSIDGGTTYQASGSFAGLSSASYHIRVRNSSSGCFVNYPGNPVVLTNPDCNEICDNGVDDDGDGLIDCADPDCGPSAYAGSDANLCIGSTTTLSATGTGGQSPYSYVWDNGLGAGQTQTVSPLATTTYTVTVTDADMCTATDQITITVTPCAEVCGDGIDNDGDGLLDCDDPECLAVGQPAPQMDEFYTCPGVALTEQVLFNDENLQSPAFSIFQNASNGSVTIDNQGVFTYTPFNTNCGNDAFIYQVCNQTTGCCDTASVFITIGDTDPPLLQNVPADITISCDESLPAAPVDIYALDACPGIYVSFQEDDDLEAASGCQSYTITRTWQATDLCGNIGTGQQIITVQDLVAPEMFRVYTLANGKKIAAGISRRTTNQWKYIEFPINFASVPLIFTQVVSENEPTAIIARQRNVTEEGFELRLQEEENADGSHSVEKVAWIAVEEGNLSDGSFQAASVPGLTSVVKTIPFAGSFSGLPATITCVQTYNEADPFTLRHNNLSSVSIDLWIEEETSADSETGHTGENLALLAVEAGQLEDEAGAFVAETGSVSLTDSWKTIPFVRQYNKPVVVFGSATSGEGPVGIRVRNVTSDAFEVRLQEWDYQDGTHPAEVVSYIVVEGSLPAQAAYYCSPDSANIQPGVNLFATDNCDAQIAFEYSDSSRFTPTGLHVFRQWAAVDDCGNRVSVARTDTCTLAAIKLRVNLFGSMLNNDGSNWMRDDLRQKGYLPLTEPYSDDPVFQHVGNGGGETTTPEILNMPGGDAVVDWVFVELRDGTDQGRVLGTCSALLQRDGDIITPMGDEVLFFPGMGESDYYISIRHRNHLGAIGATPQYMSTYSTPLIDFRADPNNMQGSMEATCTTINGSRALWAGDFNGDGKVIFQGPANDVFLLFSRIVASPENADNLANYILSGYYKEDINMDGNTIYQGPDNDRSPIIYYTILAHPGNSSLLANFIVQDWLP